MCVARCYTRIDTVSAIRYATRRWNCTKDRVSRVILSRLDRLDEQSRNMLKVASVIGRAFQQWLLQSVYPYRTQEAELGFQFDYIVVCTVTGSTHGGMLVGFADMGTAWNGLHPWSGDNAYDNEVIPDPPAPL